MLHTYVLPRPFRVTDAPHPQLVINASSGVVIQSEKTMSKKEKIEGELSSVEVSRTRFERVGAHPGPEFAKVIE